MADSDPKDTLRNQMFCWGCGVAPADHTQECAGDFGEHNFVVPVSAVTEAIKALRDPLDGVPVPKWTPYDMARNDGWHEATDAVTALFTTKEGETG